MTPILITLHLIAFSVALGGRLIFGIYFFQTPKIITDEQLEQVTDTFFIIKCSDVGLLIAALSGAILFQFADYSLADEEWAFKLALVCFALLIIDIGAFQVAQLRVKNHYDKAMIPALKRLNLLAVALMSCIVFFLSFNL